MEDLKKLTRRVFNNNNNSANTPPQTRKKVPEQAVATENPYAQDKVVSQTATKPKKEPRNFADSSDEEYGEDTPGGDFESGVTPGENPDQGKKTAPQPNSDEDDDHLRDDIEGADKSTYSSNLNNVSTQNTSRSGNSSGSDQSVGGPKGLINGLFMRRKKAKQAAAQGNNTENVDVITNKFDGMFSQLITKFSKMLN